MSSVIGVTEPGGNRQSVIKAANKSKLRSTSGIRELSPRR
jgi:hypothetical protein